MFVPSDAIYLAINETRFYEIIEFALEKKVTICSPMLLAVVVNHINWANKTWEQYKNVDKTINTLDKFWDDLGRFNKRWEKIRSSIDSQQKAINELDITTQKLINHGEKIKNLKINEDNEPKPSAELDSL